MTHQQRHAARVVLVTGAASGIGAAIAHQYALEGATLALVDVHADSLERQADVLRGLGAQVASAVADVSDYAACALAHQALVDKLGAPIDTLINNAGISPKVNGKPSNFWEMDPAEWLRVIGVNLHGAFHWARLVTPGMVQRTSGRIINMSSVAAKFYVPFTAAHYGTTKAALIGMTRDLAGELGPYNITVNALAPGRINTPLMQTASKAVNDAIVQETALRRLGEPADVAQMCCFLTAPESRFITGQVIDVAGGWLMT
jgi:3-oxoacyl-[acyl-carrier protein] reductase